MSGDRWTTYPRDVMIAKFLFWPLILVSIVCVLGCKYQNDGQSSTSQQTDDATSATKADLERELAKVPEGNDIFPDRDPNGREYVTLTGYEPKPCEPIADEEIRASIEGYTLANAIAWLLSSSNPGQRQHAYYMLTEVSSQINLHGASDFSVYKYVFCGERMKRIAKHVITDGLGEEFAMRRDRDRSFARDALDGLRLLAPALPFIERRLQTSDDQIELVQLVRMWLGHKLDELGPAKITHFDGVTTYEHPLQQEGVIKLVQELRKTAPRATSFPVVNRAIRFYEKTVSGCGAFCRDWGNSRTNEEQENEWFLNPFSDCPPEHILQEMSLEHCPMRIN